uniref:Uncharacterized protein n=1 Tax=Timema cristinae TaxID=61476 RepID=A0A7R9D0H3_TIMCR|nr:unnamed protein product [Timema cristinae]
MKASTTVNMPYRSKAFGDMCFSWGIRHVNTSPYNPSPNHVERFNLNLNDVDPLLSEVGDHPFVEKCELAFENLHKSHRKVASTYNRRRVPVLFKVGGSVVCKCFPLSSVVDKSSAKLAYKWSGSWSIHRFLTPVSVLLREIADLSLTPSGSCEPPQGCWTMSQCPALFRGLPLPVVFSPPFSCLRGPSTGLSHGMRKEVSYRLDRWTPLSEVMVADLYGSGRKDIVEVSSARAYVLLQELFKGRRAATKIASGKIGERESLQHMSRKIEIQLNIEKVDLLTTLSQHTSDDCSSKQDSITYNLSSPETTEREPFLWRHLTKPKPQTRLLTLSTSQHQISSPNQTLDT